MDSLDADSIAPARRPVYQGILSINASMAIFVVSDAIMKLLSRSFPPNELIFLRSVIIAVALGTIMLTTGRRPSFKRGFAPAMLLRCLFDCLNIVAFTVAVIHMQLAELYAILLTSPFLMTLIAALFLKEPVGYRRWAAAGVGFVGVLLIVKPDPHAFNQWALLGLLSALGSSVREAATKKIDPSIPAMEVTFYSAIVAGAVPFFFGWNETWPAITPPHYLMIAAQASCWLAGAFLLIQACRLAPLSVVASFRYSLLIWGGLAGYLVFGEVPDNLSFIGALLIVGCGLYTFHRETVRQRRISSDVVTLS
jgi:drug/metabolite transporter (DMT)-like permease